MDDAEIPMIEGNLSSRLDRAGQTRTMQHPEIDQHDVVGRYLRSELSSEEAAAFEEHSLACPACLDALEADLRLREGMRSLAEQDPPALPILPAAAASPVEGAASAVLGQAGPSGPPLPFPAPDRRAEAPGSGSPWRWVWAASLLLATLPALLLLRQNQSLERALVAQQADHALALRELEAQARNASAGAGDAGDGSSVPGWVQADVALLRLGVVRSAATEPAYRLRLGRQLEWVVLVLEPPEPLAEQYGLALRGPDGETVWDRRAVAPDAYGSLSVGLASDGLRDGIYRLHLSTEKTTELEVAFRVVRVEAEDGE